MHRLKLRVSTPARHKPLIRSKEGPLGDCRLPQSGVSQNTTFNYGFAERYTPTTFTQRHQLLHWVDHNNPCSGKSKLHPLGSTDHASIISRFSLRPSIHVASAASLPLPRQRLVKKPAQLDSLRCFVVSCWLNNSQLRLV